MDSQGHAECAQVMEVLQPGAIVRQYYGPDDLSNLTLHIRAQIDGEWVVYKYWEKSKFRWEYRIDWYYIFWLLMKSGNLLNRRGDAILSNTDIEEGEDE